MSLLCFFLMFGWLIILLVILLFVIKICLPLFVFFFKDIKLLILLEANKC